MAAGGTNSDIPDEVWETWRREQEDKVKYYPAFTAQINRISDQIVPISETVVRILFDKSKSTK